MTKMDWERPPRIPKKAITPGIRREAKQDGKWFAARVKTGKPKKGLPVKVYTPGEIAEFERKRQDK